MYKIEWKYISKKNRKIYNNDLLCACTFRDPHKSVK